MKILNFKQTRKYFKMTEYLKFKNEMTNGDLYDFHSQKKMIKKRINPKKNKNNISCIFVCKSKTDEK